MSKTITKTDIKQMLNTLYNLNDHYEKLGYNNDDNVINKFWADKCNDIGKIIDELDDLGIRG